MPNPLQPPSQRVFPVGLLAEGRLCLVVGGGTVAERKVGFLLESGAKVRVVSPALTAGLHLLAQSHTIQYQARPFEPDDPLGMLLVFAATHDKQVNREVLEACRRAGVLCCPVDGNWTEGDFVSPAVLRQGDVTVAISTGGRSCRKSRMLRDEMSHHIERIESAELIVLGTSHAELSIARREPLHLTDERLAAAGDMLKRIHGLHEFALLNTCNRIEFIGLVSHAELTTPLIARILRFDDLAPNETYLRRAQAAFAHLALLTAGLLSQTPGESNIVGQVKAALSDATRRRWAGALMQEWLASGLHVAKTIRARLAPLLRSVEIEDLCLAFLAAEVPALKTKRVAVIGSGVVGRGIVMRLLPRTSGLDWIFHTRRPAPPGKAGESLSIVAFDQLPARLAEADIVICAATRAGPVLDAEHARWFDPHKSVMMVDLAIPRNIDPEIVRWTPPCPNGTHLSHGSARRLALPFDVRSSLVGRTVLGEPRHNHLMPVLSKCHSPLGPKVPGSPGLRLVDLDDLKLWSRRGATDLERIHRLGLAVIEDHTQRYERLVNCFHNGNARQ